MTKKADILRDECSGWHSTADCHKCPEYDECDMCDRRLCNYVAVHVWSNGEDTNELVCQSCARSLGGWSESELATQVIDLAAGLSGEDAIQAMEATP